MDFNGLTDTLNTFIAAFSGGFGRLSGAINGLLALLAGIDIVLLGFWWALGGGEHLPAVFKKILYMGFWIWMVRSFPTISKAFVDSLVQAGFMAGGGGPDQSLLLDPSRIAGLGLDATAPLAEKMLDMSALDVADLLVFGLAYIGIMLCFLVMAINVFLAVLEYYLIAAIVGILMPFGLLNPTKFLAEKAIGAVVATGVKLCVLSFILAVVDPVLRGIHFAGDEISLNELWAMFLTICSLMLLTWKAPGIASSLLAGSPTLGTHDVSRPIQTAVAAAVGASTGVRAASSSQPSSSSSSTSSQSSTAAAASPSASQSSSPAAGASLSGNPNAASQSSGARAGGGGAAPNEAASPALVRSVLRPPDTPEPTRLDVASASPQPA